MIKRIIKKIGKTVLQLLPRRNYIIFESVPVFSDNTRAVFDEMVRREMYKEYRFIWVCFQDVELPHDIQFVKFVRASSGGIVKKIYLQYLYHTACAFISCNNVLTRRRIGQYAIFLMHGAPIKDISGHYRIPENVDDIVSFSEYMIPYEAKSIGAAIDKMRLLGYPRNDVLLTSTVDSHSLFSDRFFDKLIYWMPTYRQHKTASMEHSRIAMPIIYNEEIAQKVNRCAQQYGVLVIVKPHFAQDVSRITRMNLSNLLFIDDQFLADRGVSNYELLGKTDALLTDYSSVYFDYLLTDRPIGLCWDDYEDYKNREGFLVDMEVVPAGGEKIYTVDDLCGFISRIGCGEDALCKERRAVTNMIHGYLDANSSQRVVDYILQKITSLSH